MSLNGAVQVGSSNGLPSSSSPGLRTVNKHDYTEWFGVNFQGNKFKSHVEFLNEFV